MKKILVAYFSATGNTKKLAKALSDTAKADLFEIKPAVIYTEKDLDWMNKSSRSSIEMNNPDSRPKIESKVENMYDYNTIFVGFPIWWYTAPRIINTFLESYDLSNKTIITFATSGGSDMGDTNEKLQKSCSSTTVFKAGKRFDNFDSNSLKLWINSIGI